MYRDGEDKLDELQNMQPLSGEARAAFDKAYKTLLNDSYVEGKSSRNNWRMKGSFVLVTMVLVGLILAFTPIGKAVSDFLGFGQTSSKTLNETNFVTKQGGVEEDKGISISLEELYSDKNETGFYFKVNLPKDSKLLAGKFDEHTLGFSWIAADGEVLLDLNGAEQSKNKIKNTSGYTGKSYVDRENHSIEFAYKYRGNTKIDSDLKGTYILITKIGATDSTSKKVGAGLQTERKEGTYEVINGKWKIPVKTDQIKKYPSLKYSPVNEDLRGDIEAVVTPTALMVNIKVSSGMGKGGTPDNMWVSTESIDGGEQKYSWREAKMYGTGDGKYYQLIFDYPNYDSSNEFTIHLPNDVVDFERVESLNRLH
ncbi:DUF4179 domain-containing protein [Enterococcus gilvus]|uniref:DUF4179 domain-containing protein n=1 Tax=Enterococcus gilvus TaxID=160453 RepID=UPI001C8C2727|nr:DUF4179 domain-containing protein [Enterococcus gilvus]MBX8938919.1 DUF4179 domain-containing protein [Enterococcus gilvus]